MYPGLERRIEQTMHTSEALPRGNLGCANLGGISCTPFLAGFFEGYANWMHTSLLLSPVTRDFRRVQARPLHNYLRDTRQPSAAPGHVSARTMSLWGQRQ